MRIVAVTDEGETFIFHSVEAYAIWAWNARRHHSVRRIGAVEVVQDRGALLSDSPVSPTGSTPLGPEGST